MRFLPFSTLLLLLIALPVRTGIASSEQKELIKMANGFDFPVGPPDAEDYYKSRGFRPNGHLGEDWNGLAGGDTDLGDPVYATAHGVVVFARDARLGWGNVVILRHCYEENAGERQIKVIDSLYGHLDEITVREGQSVRRGQQIGTIGNNRGMYSAHLHFEIRKNIQIGLRRSSFGRDFSNYFDPTNFIVKHRKLNVPKSKYYVQIDTFDDDRKFFNPNKGLGKFASWKEQKGSFFLKKDEKTGEGAEGEKDKKKKKKGTFFQSSPDEYFY